MSVLEINTSPLFDKNWEGKNKIVVNQGGTLSGKTYSISATIKEGISSENAKKVSKLIRDEAPKSVKSQIQGDELRVSSKSKDDLQDTMTLIKNSDFDFAVQFTNFR